LYGLRMARETSVVWMPGGVRTEIQLTQAGLVVVCESCREPVTAADVEFQPG